MSFKFHFKPLFVAVIAVSLTGCFGGGKKSGRSRSAPVTASVETSIDAAIITSADDLSTSSTVSTSKSSSSDALSTSSTASTSTSPNKTKPPVTTNDPVNNQPMALESVGYKSLKNGIHLDGSSLTTQMLPSLVVDAPASMPSSGQYNAYKKCLRSMSQNPGVNPTEAKILTTIWPISQVLIQCCRDVFGNDALNTQYKSYLAQPIQLINGFVNLANSLTNYYKFVILDQLGKPMDFVDPALLKLEISKKVLLERISPFYAQGGLGHLLLNAENTSTLTDLSSEGLGDVLLTGKGAPKLHDMTTFVKAHPGDTLTVHDIFAWHHKYFSGTDANFILFFSKMVLEPIYRETLLCKDNAMHDNILNAMSDPTDKKLIEGLENAVCVSQWEDYLVNVANEALSTGYCKMS